MTDLTRGYNRYHVNSCNGLISYGTVKSYPFEWFCWKTPKYMGMKVSGIFSRFFSEIPNGVFTVFLFDSCRCFFSYFGCTSSLWYKRRMACKRRVRVKILWLDEFLSTQLLFLYLLCSSKMQNMATDCHEQLSCWMPHLWTWTCWIINGWQYPDKTTLI